jgi:tRNA1Val (adenine37-N6)-methyltransferase
MDTSFRFKQFTIRNDATAMKVGTDGVLLGAWASLEGKPRSVLDIGAGTGLVALMLAQRSLAENIDAIEIDAPAFEQCVENFEASPWPDRLFCYHCGLGEFAQEVDEPYGLILSNPPFYSEDVSSGNPARDAARQQSFLPFEALLEGVCRLLDPDGIFCLILPHREEGSFVSLGQGFGLFPSRITRVRGTAQSPVKRSLMEFSFREVPPREDLLTLEVRRNQYTEAYKALTRDFYLKM